jgi:hypothetical protein
MNSCQKYFAVCVLSLLTQAAFAQSAPALGSASGFAVLSAAPNGTGAVTCTDAPISGDVGSSGARVSVVTTRCSISGAIVAPVPTQVVSDFNAAYAAVAPKPGDVCPIITGTLADKVLTPGVYCVSAEAKTGVLTLSGPSNATWTFKVAPGAFTGSSFTVVMAGGAQACNVTWWVDAATTMTDSNLKGTILSGAAITFSRGTYIGNALAKAAVTMTGVAATGCTNGISNPPPKPECDKSVSKGSKDCKGHDHDRDDEDNDHDDKDHDRDDDKDHHGKNGSPFGSHDDRDDKRGDSDRKGGAKK